MAGIKMYFLLVLYIAVVPGALHGAKRTIRTVNQAWQIFAQVTLLQDHIRLGENDEVSQERRVTKSSRARDVGG